MSRTQYPYYSQPSAEQLRRNIEESRRQAGLKGRHYDPITVECNPRQLCHTWWGNAWCENMTRYLDYDNRLARGKRYAKNGSILDLKISKGTVRALVQGSRKKPYQVTIAIDPLSEPAKEAILQKTSARISSLDALVQGTFPDELKDIFTMKNGLFPGPGQIRFHCSCPDIARMCKHVAAVMYGIGIRLDENPLYFFELRGIEADSFVRKTVENKVEAMLANADKPSSRILDESCVEDLFGLES